MSECVRGRVRVIRGGAHRGQRVGSNSLELELQVVVNSLMWVLGTKLLSSASTINVLNG